MLHAAEISQVLTGVTSHKIVITTHHKPDADALGSSLGLYNFLLNQGFKDVTVITPTDYADFLKWMPGEDKVMNFEMQAARCRQITAEASIIFCLDFNALKRINEYGKEVEASKAIKILIDHHQQPEAFAHFSYWDKTASSTCELVYRLIRELNATEYIDSKVAECLYTGIVTDTGSFRFDSVTPQTLHVAADLIEKGAKNYLIADRIFDNFSLERTRFIGYVLYNKLEILPDLPVALMHVNAQELREFNIRTGDTEGLVNFGLSIKGVELAALIIDRTKLVKMSFRGKGQFPCHEFAREFFNGGGHFNAAGGESNLSLEATLEKFKTSIHTYAQYLK